MTLRMATLNPMATRTKKPATYQDIIDLPENLVGEIVDGELVVSPRPMVRHARVASVLGRSLGGPFDDGREGPGGWWILDEVELHWGDDVLVPDLAGWRRTRMPNLRDEQFITLAPDWVCEIVSPSTARVDRGRKLRIYAREQVRHAWLVDPQTRMLEVFRREGEGWFFVGSFSDAERVRAEPFDAIELDLGTLWLPQEKLEAAR